MSVLQKEQVFFFDLQIVRTLHQKVNAGKKTTSFKHATYSHVMHAVNVTSLPQDKQGDETESCRHQEDEAGVPGHRSSVHAVENGH